MKSAMSNKMLIFKTRINFVLGSSLPPLPRINSTTELIRNRNRFCGIDAYGFLKSLKIRAQGKGITMPYDFERCDREILFCTIPTCQAAIPL